MESTRAVKALSALAHETRLAVFRRLVTAGPGGLPAGGIAHDLGVVPATLSFHLGHLQRAGLLRSWRVQRNAYYAADYCAYPVASMISHRTAPPSSPLPGIKAET